MKNLPFNLLAERLIINIILSNPDLVNLICHNLTVEAFYFEKHQKIFTCIKNLLEQGKPIELITVATWLEDNKQLTSIGGIDTLTDILQESGLGVNVHDYLALIQDKFIRRSLINLGYKIIDAGYNTEITLEILLKQIEIQIFNLTQKTLSESITSSAEILSEIFSEIKVRSNNNSNLGLTTLFYDLDALTQGFQKSDLIIIAGRPSMGKTALCLNLARNIAFKHNKEVIFFSLEMSKEQIGYRLLASEAGIDLSRLRSGRVYENEWEKLKKSFSKLSNLKLYIDDNPSPSLSEIRLKIRELLNDKYSIQLLIIDYLQLLEAPSKKNNRVQELSEITRILKNMAREFDIPIIVLSQLSRNVENRLNKRPILSDLRESGCISFNETIKRNKNKIISFYKKKFYLTSNYKIKLTGIKPCYNVILKSGKSILITRNHKILTELGWKNLFQFTKNEKLIAFSERLGIQSYPQLTFEYIKAIHYVGLKTVYDLEVPLFNTFICNDIIVHNSIEQDADVVIMLYRDDYYNKKSLEINIIELQIAKQRNGPLGLVKLYFEPRYNRFYNLSTT